MIARLLILVVLLLTVIGCTRFVHEGPLQAYPGPKKSTSEIAIVRFEPHSTEWERFVLEPKSIDGRTVEEIVGLPEGPVSYRIEDDEVHLEPGLHTIQVSFRHGPGALPFQSKPELQRPKIRFTAEAGHQYRIHAKGQVMFAWEPSVIFWVADETTRRQVIPDTECQVSLGHPPPCNLAEQRDEPNAPAPQ